jgi:viologen exporter family transport system permease protein
VADALALYARLVGAQVRSQFQYRTSFALDLTANFAITFIDFAAVLILFENVTALDGWTLHEVAFLYACTCISFAFVDMVIGHLDLFPRMIREGTFDLVLVRPRGSLFQVIASDFAFRRLGRAIQGVVVFAYALTGLDIDWDPGRVAMVGVMLVSGALIFSAVWIAGATIAFWTVDGGEFTNAFTYGGNFLTQYPISIYGDWLRRFLAFVVPMAFVCYFPSLYVLDKEDPLGFPRALQFASPLVALLAAAVAGMIWVFAVRRYRSVGS